MENVRRKEESKLDSLEENLKTLAASFGIFSAGKFRPD
jgi:hypothetical protein